jgi:alanyl-tRNA synthetase
MENLESKNIKNIEFNKDLILNSLGLTIIDESETAPFLKLKTDVRSNNLEIKKSEKILLDSPDGIFKHFENIKIIKPDKICRPSGDTTFFTAAGVQHIETILKKDGVLKKEKFVMVQPVIRSQFMDRVEDGVSTSFINFSIESIDANPAEFVELSNKFIELAVNQGIDPEKLRFQIEELSDRWGDRKFNKTVLTLYFNGIELGECVYMHNYPATESQKINIVDIGFGVERFNWGIGNNKNYFPEFDKFYVKNIDSNKVTSIIDSIRTAVLIANEGIRPSNHDHGYRLRQLSKRFVSRNQGMNLDFNDLVHTSYEYWGKWDSSPSLSEDDVLKVINQENERNWNSLFLSRLKENSDFNICIDINQTSTNFLQQINASLPKEAREIINETIKKIK